MYIYFFFQPLTTEHYNGYYAVKPMIIKNVVGLMTSMIICSCNEHTLVTPLLYTKTGINMGIHFYLFQMKICDVFSYFCSKT